MYFATGALGQLVDGRRLDLHHILAVGLRMSELNRIVAATLTNGVKGQYEDLN
jgi:hypothetical protein